MLGCRPRRRKELQGDSSRKWRHISRLAEFSTFLKRGPRIRELIIILLYCRSRTHLRQYARAPNGRTVEFLPSPTPYILWFESQPVDSGGTPDVPKTGYPPGHGVYKESSLDKHEEGKVPKTYPLFRRRFRCNSK